MLWSMRDTVRYAARFAVYEEQTMSVKSHQLPITILRATEPTTPSPPEGLGRDRVLAQH